MLIGLLAATSVYGLILYICISHRNLQVTRLCVCVSECTRMCVCV